MTEGICFVDLEAVETDTMHTCTQLRLPSHLQTLLKGLLSTGQEADIYNHKGKEKLNLLLVVKIGCLRTTALRTSVPQYLHFLSSE